MRQSRGWYLGAGIPVVSYKREPEFPGWGFFFAVLALCLIFIVMFLGKAHAEAITLKASWYSESSLKKEGSWKLYKGVMANGEKFDEEKPTCATRLFELGRYVRVTNTRNGKTVICKVSDRIGKRFATTRIDLSRSAFEKIADLKVGLVPVTVEVINART